MRKQAASSTHSSSMRHTPRRKLKRKSIRLLTRREFLLVSASTAKLSASLGVLNQTSRAEPEDLFPPELLDLLQRQSETWIVGPSHFKTFGIRPRNILHARPDNLANLEVSCFEAGRFEIYWDLRKTCQCGNPLCAVGDKLQQAARAMGFSPSRRHCYRKTHLRKITYSGRDTAAVADSLMHEVNNHHIELAALGKNIVPAREAMIDTPELQIAALAKDMCCIHYSRPWETIQLNFSEAWCTIERGGHLEGFFPGRRIHAAQAASLFERRRVPVRIVAGTTPDQCKFVGRLRPQETVEFCWRMLLATIDLRSSGKGKVGADSDRFPECGQVHVA